jgi:hypothetical protein
MRRHDDNGGGADGSDGEGFAMEAHDLMLTRHSAAGDVKRLKINGHNNNILQLKDCYIIQIMTFYWIISYLSSL